MGKTLLLDFITDPNCKMWIGGTKTSIEEKHTARTVSLNTNVAEVKSYDVELTPEQVAANYAYTTVTPVAITWDPNRTEEPDPTEEPGTDEKFEVVAESKWATYNKDTDMVSFAKVEDRDALASRRGSVGLQIKNPFAGKKELVQTLEEALSGQAIFPYRAENGGTLDDGSGQGGQSPAENGTLACDTGAVRILLGNFYDVYYGPVNMLGNRMNPATCIGERDQSTGMILESNITGVQSQKWLEENLGDQKTTFQRPKWTNGASISFWAKPVEVDDSPLITFYNPATTNVGTVLSVSVRGDVMFFSTHAKQTIGGVEKNIDWREGYVASNGKPVNTFTALGDPKYVEAGKWNYYTITIANDWITVYVNGKEMVYTLVNLNRGQMVNFNHAYLSRYNTIGIWTKDMLKAYEAETGEKDPSGKTLDGIPREYLIKSGHLWDLNAPDTIDDKGGVHNALDDKNSHNTGHDATSIRFNGVYADPLRKGSGTTDSADIMTRLTQENMQLYLGGIYSNIHLEGKFYISDMRMPEDTDRTTVHYSEEAAKHKFWFTNHTLDEGTKISAFSSEMKEMTAQEVKAAYEKAVAPTE